IHEGKVQAQSEGEVTITAEYEGKSAISNVRVTNKILENITLDKNALQIPEGSTQQLILTAHYSDNTSSVQTTIATWETDSVGKATVVDGKVTGVAVGEALITATLNEKSVSAKVFVVEETQIESIELVVPKSTLKVGETQSLQVNVVYKGSSTITDVTDRVSWNSKDNHVYITNGNMIAYSEGEDTITASFGGKSVSKDIEIKDRLLRNIELYMPYTLDVGKSYPIRIWGYDFFGNKFVLSPTEPYLEYKVYKDTSKSELSDAFSVKDGMLEILSVATAILEVRIPRGHDDLVIGGNLLYDNYELKDFHDPFTVVTEGGRVSPSGEEYFAAGDLLKVKAYYFGEDVSEQITLSLGESNYDLFKLNNNALEVLYVPDTSGNIGSGKYGEGALSVTYSLPNASSSMEKTIAVYNVGREIDDIEIHQFFPEPKTTEAEVETTKLVIAEDMGRQFFVTVKYSDGVTETSRNTELDTLNSSTCRDSSNPISFLKDPNKNGDWISFSAIKDGFKEVKIGSVCDNAQNAGLMWGMLKPTSSLTPGDTVTVRVHARQSHNSPDIGARSLHDELDLNVVSAQEYQNATSMIPSRNHDDSRILLTGPPTHKDLLDIGGSATMIGDTLTPNFSIKEFINLGGCDSITMNKFGRSGTHSGSKLNSNKWLLNSGTSSNVPTFIMKSSELRESYLGWRFNDLYVTTNKTINSIYQYQRLTEAGNYSSIYWISPNVKGVVLPVCLMCEEGKALKHDVITTPSFDHYSARCE
ncbi:Ig-like domain-containing protein, partial [Vibrio rotiferianus]|uniref:Ig-like domain-containing protein n=1 Tax=Vibrio rotiferianus TaxID=190895 RepID=UPI00406A2B00